MSTVLRPTPTLARDYSFPRFERHRLPNGLNVLIAPVHKLPMVTIDAVVDAGAECDPPERVGLAQLTAQLLAEGAGSMDGAALTERFELLGTSLSTAADWDSAAVTLSVMKGRFGEAIETLGDVLTRPQLPRGELERLKAERLAELLQMRTEPRSLADEMFSAFVYDPSSRYSRPLGGSEKSVSAIGVDDVTAFHGARYTPANTTIVVAGDVQVADALAQIGKSLGEWRGIDAARPRIHTAPLRAKSRVHLVVKADAPQSELRIGQVGLPRITPDYFDVVVMNAILGGLFSSRINLNLRERHGYTYGAFSRFDWRHDAGPFVVSSAVKSDVTVESIREVLTEIARMRDEMVTEDELSLAVNYLAGVFPIRFETTAAIAAALASLAVYDLPANYYDSYRDEISSVTRERVLHAARKYLHVDDLEVVVVGDPSVVQDTLGAFAAAGLDVRNPADMLE